MKAKLVKKTILLFMVLFMGVFFLIGSAEDKADGTYGDAYDPLQPDELVGFAQGAADAQREKESLNLSHSNKIKFDKLMRKRNALWNKISTPSKTGMPHVQLKKEYNTITKEVDKLLEEPQLTGRNESDAIAIARNDRKQEKIQKEKLENESNQACFPKNTKVVMYDGSLKAIDTITEGDKVMIYDIANDTIGSSIVNKKYVDNNNHMYIINNSIQATAYERFLTQAGWKRINSINTTDSVFNGNSFIDVNSISKVKKDLTVYNLNINSTHNFFVSYGQDDEWFLIHNSGGGGGGGK